MNKFFSFICLAAVAGLTVASCSKNEDVENLSDSIAKKVTFIAKSSNPATKTQFGDKTSSGYPTIWTSTQKVSVALNYANAVQADVTPSADGKTAIFNAEVTDDGSGNYVFYALSPAVAASSWEAASSRVEVVFPATQTPTMSSVDEAAHIMAAKSATFTTFPDNVSLSFSHIAAYGRFTLKDFPEDVTISGIDLEADENIAGSVYFYPATGTYADKTASKTISLNVSAISAESNASKVFWFAVKPVDLQGKNLKVTVHTNVGDYVKTITFPAGKGNFQAGRVASFTIEMPLVEKTATIQFGSGTGRTKINAATVTGNDSQGNTWTITTTQNPDYDQETDFSIIGDEHWAAGSITFTTTLERSAKIKSLSIKLGGVDDDTDGLITLKVGDTAVGSGSLWGTPDVTVSSTTVETGKVLTIIVTNIYSGVKAYNIDVTYEN